MFSLLTFAALIWFATSVPLGKKTLWRHLQAIFATREAHELAEGTKDEARKVADRLRGHPDLGVSPGAPAPKAEAGPPLDPMKDSERRELDKLIKQKVK